MATVHAMSRLKFSAIAAAAALLVASCSIIRSQPDETALTDPAQVPAPTAPSPTTTTAAQVALESPAPTTQAPQVSLVPVTQPPAVQAPPTSVPVGPPIVTTTTTTTTEAPDDQSDSAQNRQDAPDSEDSAGQIAPSTTTTAPAAEIKEPSPPPPPPPVSTTTTTQPRRIEIDNTSDEPDPEPKYANLPLPCLDITKLHAKSQPAASGLTNLSRGPSAAGAVPSPPPPPPPIVPPPVPIPRPNVPIEERGYTDAYDDPLSTFALDADTGSFYYVTRRLAQGTLPYAEEVRVEEFINSLPAGHEEPNDNVDLHVDAVHAANGSIVLRVSVQAASEPSVSRQPDSIVLVVDISGSMSGTEKAGTPPKYKIVQRLIKNIADEASPGTRIAAVLYSDDAFVALMPEEVTKDTAALINKDVSPTLSTNAEAGLKCGFNIALQEADAGHTAAVILLSDGVANVGSTETQDILDTIGDRSDIGLTTIGVGFGTYNDLLMEQLADRADGTYHYVGSYKSADELTGRGLQKLISVAAAEARIQVRFDHASVDRYRLVGYENRELADNSFEDDTKDAAELPFGSSSTALYEIELYGTPQDTDELLEVTLRYLDPASRKPIEITKAITLADVAQQGQGTIWIRAAMAVSNTARDLRTGTFPESYPDRLRELVEVSNLAPEGELKDTLDRLIDAIRSWS